MINVATANWMEQQKVIATIRRLVFIDEQGVAETDEWDTLDAEPTTIHLLAYSNETAVGTARLLASGQIGRMCVLKPYRHQNIGRHLLTAALTYASENIAQPIFLHAQISAIGFYEKFGFQTDGDIFEDAGIQHRRMYIP
jgi:predicted GNAT family N-acyltransferase